MKNKLIDLPQDFHDGLDDDLASNQSMSVRQSIFKMGDSIYRSVYQKPMTATLWICCYKLERAPLV